jgi:hypothetical protein|tara:strand:+ start:918 stop:1313 length:396 start_codon:yes stop_codon:yes gene_type:complete
MEIHYKVIGYLLILLSIVHVIFPRYFNWKEELKTLSLINQELMKVHTFFIALVVLLIGMLCLISTAEMIYTDLGKTVSLGIGIFWVIRLVFQFVGYSSVLWKGKKLETTIHILAIILWTYLSAIFLYVYFK